MSGFDLFSDLFTDSDDFNFESPSGGSHLSAPNGSEDKPEHAIKNDEWHDDVLDMDNSDTDSVSRLYGEGEGSSMETTQIRISEAVGEDIIPHAPANGQATTPAGCMNFF